jgi:hypothetical protein
MATKKSSGIRTVDRRKVALFEVVFLFLIGASSMYYIMVGEAKTYVRFFGIFEILYALAASTMFFSRLSSRKPISMSLIVFHSVLCLSQLAPLIGALVLGGRYTVMAAAHGLIILLGVLNVFAIRIYNTKIPPARRPKS